ncbi:protein PTCD3 homolog, mitochondrial [Diabrotica virgifera virgifera]|uniref:Small ribosomal subunit protein mS39 n=1 Tax=Diabrotica virgifera virgifera TaxID=50390 RepID=A0ABM5IGK9_DIAVI|nr:protein PTCD3 homolog, mitochondrial [Diabrotica virgifera virgifera]
MNLSAICLRRTPVLNSSLKTWVRGFSSSNTEERIEIPNRIPRGPTDILRALESTISRDPTASHYKYHDDPYLIPKSNVSKRTFAMAQEAGRKAAHWIRKEHADLFNHLEADPIVPSFLPKLVYTEDSKVTEDDLKKVIQDIQILDAQLVYQLLKKQGVVISPETQQSLLELVCYFNSDDTLPEEFIEERWFKQSSNQKERQRKTWKDGSFAEELFQSLENPTAESYSAMIQGMSKYFQVERAWKLFEEAQQKGLVLSPNTYNSLLKVANFLKESFEMRWTFIVNLLADMNRAGVKPNLGTMNAILHSLSTMGRGKSVREYALQVLAEFRGLGVEPSLGSWYYVLITYCKERGPISTILHDILPHIENKDHKIKDQSDTYFFVTAMDICRNHLKDVELAKRVDKLLHVGSNYDLIGDSYKESIYYRHYFVLLATSIPLEEFMTTTYEILVPNIYVPEPGVMAEVLKQVELNGAIEYIPKLWSDMTVFDHVEQEKLIHSITGIMVSNIPEKNSSLHENFANIAWDIHTRVENQNTNKVNKLSLTGNLLGRILLLILRNDDFEKACIIMDKLDKDHQTIAGVPDIEALECFVDSCIERKAPSRAIACIQYCADSGFQEAGIFAAKLNEKLTLDESHLNSLSRIVGDVKLAKVSDQS